jgi:hypothetical protein
VGQRYCHQGAWQECGCFGDLGDEAPLSDCKPGRYGGVFFGYYFSSFTFGFAPIPVWAWNLSGEPGLAFTLNASADVDVPEGTEFVPELEISDGYVKGTADGLFPFEGTLTGKLDCRTKRFEATLSGGYALLVDLALNTANFEGPVLGIYDSKTHSFPCQMGVSTYPDCEGSIELLATEAVADAVGGTPFPKPDFHSHWSLTEDTGLPASPLFPNIPFGGAGYWAAKWVGPGKVDPNTGASSP